jgi:hypothetical protein
VLAYRPPFVFRGVESETGIAREHGRGVESVMWNLRIVVAVFGRPGGGDGQSWLLLWRPGSSGCSGRLRLLGRCRIHL